MRGGRRGGQVGGAWQRGRIAVGERRLGCPIREREQKDNGREERWRGQAAGR